MGSFRYLLLSLLSFLIVFTVTSCDDGGTTEDTVPCSVPTECKANQDCVFNSLTAEKGVCVNRVVCEANTDCSDGLLCADDADKKFCGTREVFGIKAITLDDAKKDEPYKDKDGNMVKLEVVGSQAAFYFEVVDPSKLPAGLELSAEGNLSGTVTADVGEYTFKVKAVNGPKDAAHYYNYREATEELTIKVVEGAVTCKVDSCTEANKGVCNVVDGAIVCSCDTGYQDNDDNGTCEVTCAMSNLGCTDTQHCDDASGTATCVCNENWKDDDNGGKCNVCVTGMHINPDDTTVCDPDVRIVTCTNIPDAGVATWADAFDNGDFEQTWVNGEYIPDVDPDKCLWKCTDENKVHDVDANACICGSGLVDDGNGGCKTPCTDNQISNADGTCSCYPGYAGDDCLQCATGYKANNGLCIFDCSEKANSHVNDTNDACVCNENYFPDGDGVCVNPCEGDNAPDCGDTKVCVAVDAATTNCVCDAGLNFVDDGNGNCGCDTANTHRVLAQTGDSCECDSANNYVEDLDGTCSLDTECTVDSFTSADPVNNSYATAADITSELVDGSVHYDDLNNQAVDCSSDEDWYKVSVTANQKLSVNINFTHADGNLDLGLYVGGDAYNDSIVSSVSYNDNEAVEYIFREDTDVYIKVYPKTYSMARNIYSMDVKVADIPPIAELNGGDTCADAVEITESGVYHGTTAEATDSMDSPCSSDEDAPEVFYAITPTTDVTLKAKLDSIDFDAIIYLIDTCDATTAIECHDIGENITQELTAGVTYYLVIDGYHGESGEFNLTLELIDNNEEPVVCDPACDAEKEVCSDVEGTPTCVCDSEKNYFYNGTTCVNPCSAVTCEGDATCVASNALDTQCVYDVVGANTCEPDADIPVIETTGVFIGTVTENNNTLTCRSTVDRNDVVYKIVLSEDSYLSVEEASSDFDAVLELRSDCADDNTKIICGDFMYSDTFSGYLSAGTYYLFVEAYGNNETDPYMLNVTITPNPCNGVTCNGTNESGVCTPSNDAVSYTCECNDNSFKDDNGACVSPCDTAVCPDAAANGSETCTATSLTDYSCGCADNYFEVVADDGTRTCESGCDIANLDCSAGGEHVECRATSATEAECGCADGYFDSDDTDAFNCVEATNGGDTCTDAVSIDEGTYYGSTENFTNDYLNEATCITENERGKDVVYSVELPAGYTLDATLSADNTWVGLYLVDDCSEMNCLIANASSTKHPPVSIAYTNSGDSPLTLFLFLDAFSSDSSMNYRLDVTLTPPPHCGNGAIDTDEGEECEDADLNGATCLLGGTIACDSECHLDRTQCWECDGTDDAAQCTEPGKPLCYVDTHTCGAAQAECGNNTIENPEECDGTATFDASCPAGMTGTKTCVAAGEANECTIDDSGCELCEDSLTLNADPKNSSRDDAIDITFNGNQHNWTDLTTGIVDGAACSKVEDWYKITVPANNKISVDILFTDDDGDLDLNLYEGTNTDPVGGSSGSGHSGSMSDNEHVDNSDAVKDVETVYYIQVKYGQNIYDMNIKLEETCTVDTDCSTTGWSCINNICYSSNPCSGVACDAVNGTGVCSASDGTNYTCECNDGYFFDGNNACVTPCAADTCDSKPNSICVATSTTDFTCVCDDTYTELDGQCVQEQTFNGSDTCGDGSGLPEITQTGIFTGSVTSDDTTLGCSSGSNEVFYKVVLTEDSYLKVEETESYSDFNANLALRTTCDNADNDLECTSSDYFSGFYSAGTYYLVVEGYSSSSIDYRLEVTIKPNPCNGVTCDAVNGTGVCTASADATSYTCECNDGYFFDGNNACVTPCAADTCDAKPDSTCKATSATEYTCECNEGLYDDGNGNCVDVCANNTCDATSEKCVPVDASNYNCECADGYLDDGNGTCVEDLGVDTCDDAEIHEITASGVLVGSTSGNQNDYDAKVACGATWKTEGADVIYSINLNAGDRLEANLHPLASTDVAILLLNACDANAYTCETSTDDGGDEAIDFTATTAGTYYIVADAYISTAYDYQLTVNLTPNTTPACTADADCTDASLPKCKVDANDAMNNACVACLADADCTDGTNTVCNLTTNVCEEPASTATVGWCNTQSPEASAAQGETVYGRVYVAGVTDGAGQGANIEAMLCYYADGDTIADSVCSTANYNVDDGNNDEYMGTLPNDFSDGVYHYYFKFKAEGDADYLPCDLNNTTAGTNGTDYQNGATYQDDTGTLTITSQQAALVSNGDFESWTDASAPDEWTLIDSGLALSKDTTTIHGGTSSMAVTQSSNKQDFRQTITVTNGTTYNVSVWVYTPTGTDIKARLYMGNNYYGAYSDNTILDSWQEVTGQFTADADEDIDVGMRFYNTTGTLYVDDFTIVAQ